MDILIAFSKIAADIQYILTGEKQIGLILSKEEKELIELYRVAPLATKASTLGALTAGIAQQNGTKQVFHGSVGQVNTDSIVNNFGAKKKR